MPPLDCPSVSAETVNQVGAEAEAKWIPIGRSKFLEGSDMGVRPQAGLGL